MSGRDCDRRDFLKVAGLGASAMALPRAIQGGVIPANDPRKNIILIQPDSMDGRVMGCMGHPAMRRATPNLDALARQGVLFRNAYCNSPICVPSRASMWSGWYTHQCEGWNNYKGLSPTDPTFETYLRECGYRIQRFGKTDYLSGAHSIRARVSAWTRSANLARPQYREGPPRIVEAENGRAHESDWKIFERAIEWLKKEAPSSPDPFLLYLGPGAPHPPYVASQKYLKMIEDAGVTIPPLDRQDHPVMQYQRAVKNWRHGFSDEMVRLVRRVYFAMIAEVDAMVGELLAAIKQQGLADSTYIIFSSDHGDNAMEHRQWYKMNLYESSARVPLIIAGPDVQKGAKIETPVSLVDIYPTLMDMARGRMLPGLDGRSLMPQLKGEKSNRRDWAFAEYHDTTVNTGSFMLRRGDWKYIAYVGYEPQLFNLRDDPDEIRNLAASRPDVVKEMDDRLRRIVDYPAVDAKVKAYDKASFRQWREETRADGTYEKLMAQLFSGWDGVPAAEIKPWTEKDEALIQQWLEGK